MIKLFVGGLPFEINEITIARMFGPFGDIGTIKIVRDRSTSLSKGYAFVEMLTEEGAREAVAGIHDTELEGRNLIVNYVDENMKPASSRPSAAPVYKKIIPAEKEPVKAKRPRKQIVK
jgi:RNA recognition motif-containing protein